MKNIEKMLIGLIFGLISLLGLSQMAFAGTHYHLPSEARVKVVRNHFGQSYLRLEFKWSANNPPNFKADTAVEFEINISPKCFIQPVGGMDDDHRCKERLGKDGTNFDKTFLPNINDFNCYVDVWNYWQPPAAFVGAILDERCDGLTLSAQACASGFAATYGIEDKGIGNFAVGLHQANAFKAGAPYYYQYPVEVNYTPECMALEYDADKTNNPSDGFAWVSMQTFKNTCDLAAPCDGITTDYTCPELIGFDGSFGCLNTDKTTDKLINRLCVPTNTVQFTPGKGDLDVHGTRCVDQDCDHYFEVQNYPMYGTQYGDCKDLNKNINPGLSEVCSDGLDNDCNPKTPDVCAPPCPFGNGKYCGQMALGQNTGYLYTCQNGIYTIFDTCNGVGCKVNNAQVDDVCNQNATCADGVQNQGETGIDCGGPCPACPAGGPQDLATGLGKPWDIALDTSNIYWVENPNQAGNMIGSLRKISKNGGGITTLTSGLLEPTTLVIAGSYIYVLERNSGQTPLIRRVPINGGNPENVTTLTYGSMTHLAQDGANLFFCDYDQNLGGMIKSVPLGANVSSTVIVSGLFQSISAVDVDANYVYFSDGNNQIMRSAKNGMGLTVLGNGVANSIRVSASTIFYTGGFGAPGSVNFMSKNGGAETVLIQGFSTPSDLTFDGNRVYWIEESNGAGVEIIPLNGGQSKKYSDYGNTRAIEVDGNYVYWGEYFQANQGKIRKSLK